MSTRTLLIIALILSLLFLFGCDRKPTPYEEWQNRGQPCYAYETDEYGFPVETYCKWTF